MKTKTGQKRAGFCVNKDTFFNRTRERERLIAGIKKKKKGFKYLSDVCDLLKNVQSTSDLQPFLA